MVVVGFRSLLLITTLLICAAVASAQSPPTPVNPRTFEFDYPAAELPEIVGYWVEVFANKPLTKSTAPAKVIYLPRSSRASKGGLRVDLRNDFDGMADGEYVITLNVVGRHGQSLWSAPSDPFVLSGLASRGAPPAQAARRAPSALPPQPASATPQPAPQATADSEHHSKWWTFGVVAAVLSVVVPVLVAVFGQ